MENLLQRVKEIDIRQVARDLGFEIVQSRRMNCPFHVEDSPSLVFYPPPQNEFHCFGCGKHGDVINLYADACQIDFKTALEELATRYIAAYDGVRHKTVRKIDIKSVYTNKPILEKQFEFKPIYSEIYERFQQFCITQTATDSARKAAEYLRGRGIDDWTIRHFKLFVIKNYVVVNDFLKSNYAIEDLKGCGLMNDKGNLVFFVHPIVIPYYQDGRIVYLQGRTIGNPPDGASKYQFLSGVPRSIFNLDSIKKLRPNSEVYLTEGAFDCMTLVKNGMMAVSLGSAKIFKKEWMKYFKKYKVLISFDNDTAGINGANALIEDFLMAGILAEKRDWNKGFKDINEYFGKTM
ncbi:MULTISPECIES: CHC2 zinc finger domain-containing protein [Emticicia]|uniref:CHC2 zinc finger domain-containing protein n=1 Tax=Emticicia TaxID=312278 RepID=UPI0007D8C383|nr:MULTISPECIES: CHC2 zinc finger domain-containing protein [Emticicia]